MQVQYSLFLYAPISSFFISLRGFQRNIRAGIIYFLQPTVGSVYLNGLAHGIDVLTSVLWKTEKRTKYSLYLRSSDIVALKERLVLLNIKCVVLIMLDKFVIKSTNIEKYNCRYEIILLRLDNYCMVLMKVIANSFPRKILITWRAIILNIKNLMSWTPYYFRKPIPLIKCWLETAKLWYH